jgi:hypothetical protein
MFDSFVFPLAVRVAFGIVVLSFAGASAAAGANRAADLSKERAQVRGYVRHALAGS